MIHPLLYEINTRCWLRPLSLAAGRPITLANVPESEFADWQRRGFTHLWLMGVWTTGPRARAEAFKHADLLNAYNHLLPGWEDEDIAGSCYSIADYQVPAALGGEAGLRKFREQLRARGLKLILDFVPNHLGIDHPWVTAHPEWLVHNHAERPGTFPSLTHAGPRWIAHGKDPHFCPWIDTVQVDYRRADARAAMLELLQSIAARCDGVRCDMRTCPSSPATPRPPPSSGPTPFPPSSACNPASCSSPKSIGVSKAACNRSASTTPTTNTSSICSSAKARLKCNPTC
ncbi:MAG: alpha-amylase family glycosyl hydrolase [Verrucomicrobia bacterium]|nr:alpha-amylase family glycosyl hydrolase [Verrucomicrobiota bacterium]